MKKIDKPDFWSLEWYLQKKSEGFNDKDLADQLFIHINTFNRWKRQLEIPKFAYSFSNAKGRK
jgi:hypothetical protein